MSNSTTGTELVCVTGAGGLIGSAVCEKLAARGTAVLALDDFSQGTASHDIPATVWERADVASGEVAAVLNKHRPKAVIHCAAHPGGRSNEEPVADVNVNVIGSVRIFDWCARNGAHVVYLSSSVIYGEQPLGAIPETATLAPGTIYGISKVACEQALKVLGAYYGLSWTVLRLFATYGAGHRPSLQQGIVNVMLTQLQAGSIVIVRGSLDRLRDLLYVEDAADGIVAALVSPDSRGNIINLGTGIGVTVRDLIVQLAKALERNIEDITIREEKGTLGDPFSSVADIAQARRLLDYAPKFSLSDGLRELVRRRTAAKI
jgi:UDP-glucose 4-epimerase